MRRVIGIVSGKGGVGKTTFAANIGTALTELIKDVVVVDADISTSNLGLHLGHFGPSISLHDAMERGANIRDALTFHSSGLCFVPSSIYYERRKRLSPYRLKTVLKPLEGTIIIDSPPGLEEDVFQVLNASNEVVVVTNPELPAVTDALKVIRFAREMRKNITGVVINRIRNSYELQVGEIEEICDAPVIGRIPEDKAIRKSVFEKMPVVKHRPYSAASIEFRKIAMKLIGKTYKPPRALALRRIFA